MLLRRDLSRKWKMALSVGSVVALCGFLIPQVHANSLTQKKQELNSLQSQASANRNQLSKDTQQKQKLQSQIHSANQSIQSESQSIAANVAQLSQLQAQLQQLNSKVASTQKQLDAEKQQVQQMVRMEYEDGNVPYLQVLFQATSWQDFLDRLTMLSEVTQTESNLANRMQKLQQQLTKEQQQQKSAYQNLSARTSQLQSQLKSQKQQIQTNQTNIRMVSRDASMRAAIEAELQNRIHYTQSEIVQIQQQTAKDEANMQNKSYVAAQARNLGSANISALLSYAEKFQGLPYTYGGTSPSTGFDCSGYTQYVFNHFGIHLPRTSQDQFDVGVPVSRANLQPGDLVFYATVSNGASHVGIYIGGGRMIDSEGAGLMITDAFSPWYWGPRYLGARDVIKH